MTRLKLILITVLPIVLILGLVLFGCISHLSSEGVDDIREQMEEAVKVRASKIHENIGELAKDADSIELLLTGPKSTASEYIENMVKTKTFVDSVVIAYDTGFVKEVLNGDHPDYKLENHFSLEPRKNYFGYSPFIYRDENGKIVTSDERGIWFKYREWIPLAEKTRTGQWTDSYVSAFTGRRVCSYVIPFYYGTRQIGAVLISYALNQVFLDFLLHNNAVHFVPKSTALQENVLYQRDIFLWEEVGNEIDFSNEKGACRNLYAQVPQSRREVIWPLLDLILKGEAGAVLFQGKDLEFINESENTWIVSSPIQNKTGLLLVVTLSERLVLASVHRQILFYLIGGILLTLFLPAVVLTIVLRAFQPVLEITRVARQVADGDLDIRVPAEFVRGKSETAVLAGTFNTMLQNLQDNIQNVKSERTKRERVERDLTVGQMVQKALLPRKYSITDNPSFYLNADYVPARFLSGDFFDFWQLDENRIALVVADVSGKGVPAAMYMVITRTLLRQITRPDRSPGDVLTEVNVNLLMYNVRNMFVTLFFAYYNTQTGELTYCNAGHNPPAIIRKGKNIENFPRASNLIMGNIPGIHYKTESIVLEKRDAVFLYTDGVPDTESEFGELFGKERFHRLLEQLAPNSEEEFLPPFMETLRTFGGKNQKDDITVLYLERREDR